MRKTPDFVKYAAGIVPDERQLKWQELGFNALVSYGMNTYTNSEWGNGNEDPELFAPTALDCRQWAKLCKLSGIKGLILTVKHQDGFCLWPSAYTDHCVSASKWKDGKGDVVAECAAACRELKLFGLKLLLHFQEILLHLLSLSHHVHLVAAAGISAAKSAFCHFYILRFYYLLFI